MNKCPKCGKTFTCDLESGKSRCWCFDIDIDTESLMSLKDSGLEGCLCRECLLNVKDRSFKSLYKKLSQDN